MMKFEYEDLIDVDKFFKKNLKKVFKQELHLVEFSHPLKERKSFELFRETQIVTMNIVL